MKLLSIMKDGGKESSVTGYWLVESKKFLSVLLLRFDGQSREAFHTHAFTSWNWVLKGSLRETFYNGTVKYHKPSLFPVKTLKTDFHKVDSIADRTWVFSVRGPWAKQWKEYLPDQEKFITLSSGRQIVEEKPIG